MHADGYLLEMDHIKKSFPGVKALDDVQLKVKPGEIHALMGENGAGKSTLIKILTGVYKASAGVIKIEGKEVNINNVQQAQQAGISAVFQELNMIPYLSVAENIFLGTYPINSGKNIMWKKMEKEAQALLDDIGLDIEAGAQLGTLGTATQQMVSIARSVSRNCKILVLDEPTSSLDSNEVQSLFKIMRRLKNKNIGIIFISHRLNEVYEICENVTVLRDGKYIGSWLISEISNEELVTSMVGRKVENEKTVRGKTTFDEDYLLEVKDLACFPKVKKVTLGVHKGEILGLTGLLGSGRSETAQLIFGCNLLQNGKIIYKGKEIQKQTPRKAISMGMAFCTENRREEGIIPDMSIRDNIVLSSLKRLSKNGVVRNKERDKVVKRYIDRLKIKTPSEEKRIRLLSGGNQQKVILARWLATEPDLIILDEPTRGIDVGAKQEIEKLVREFVKQGISIIYISSEISELVRNCDRVVVLSDGCTTGELVGDEISEDNILAMIAAGSASKGGENVAEKN